MHVRLTTTGRRTGEARAVTRLWKLVTREFPLYETYQRRMTRTILLFVLEA